MYQTRDSVNNALYVKAILEQRLHIVTKDVISLSISVLLLFRHYISHKITFGAPSSGGVLCSACGAFIFHWP